MTEYVYLRPPWGQGEPQRFEARPDLIVPLMNSGWSQCDPPASGEEEVIEHVG
jgi:hypothetical protein